MLNLPSLLEAMFKNESLKDESRDIIENIFSKENIKNEELLDHLLSLLKAMVKNKSLKNEAKYIIKNLFSEENIGTVLKSEIFMGNLPSLLEAMFKNESLKDEARDIIENIFSKENIKNYWLAYNLPSLLEAMFENESLKDEARGIIKNLFSEENIGTVLKSEIFMGNLPSLLEDIFENESFEDDVKYIIKNLFSEKNIGTVLKNYWFVIKLPSLLEDMIENKSFENDVKYIIKNMFLSNMSSNKNLGEVLRSVDLSLGRLESATGNIIKGLAKEMLEKEYKDFEKKEPNNIVKNLISSKNIMPELSSSSMQKGISSFRNKTEDSASDFIRNILGNNSVPEELKSELKALLDDFSAKRRKFIPQELIKEGGKTRNRELAVSQREG